MFLFVNLDQDVPGHGGGLAEHGGPVLGVEGVHQDRVLSVKSFSVSQMVALSKKKTVTIIH